MKKLFFLILALLPLSIAAQDFSKDMEGIIDRIGSVNYSYPALASEDTPAPRGYKPVYVSHYGRHGSRSQIGSGGRYAYERFKKASEAGVLTPGGEAFLEDLTVFWNTQNGMDGQLSVRGGKEHQGIAHRMYGRFKPVFKGGRQVRCQSSTIQRCLISMANFANALKGDAPSLAFDFVTGEKYMKVLLHPYFKEGEGLDKMRNKMRDSLSLPALHPGMYLPRFFKDCDKSREIIGDSLRLAKYITYAVTGAQCMYYEMDGKNLYSHFTEQELVDMGIFMNERYYMSFGPSLEYGDLSSWAQQWLLKDFIVKADEALASGTVAADLRFGHDSTVYPFLCLMGVEGVSRRYPSGEATRNGYYVWQYIPMGTNVQMIFYQSSKKGSDTLVKILHNEKEVRIPALETVSGPYYSWPVLKEYFLSLCPEAL